MSWEKETFPRGWEHTQIDSTKAWSGGPEEKKVHGMQEGKIT